MTVAIVVDVHERASRVADMLSGLGAEITFASLPAGDYAVGAGTLVERKTVDDLHGAILRGRLWPQMGKLRSESEFPYLAVEGRDLDRGPLHPNAVRGACLAVIDRGIALLRTSDRADTARWLHRLAVRSQRAEEPPDRPAYSQLPKAPIGREAAEAVLAAIPGVSTVSARALLTRFGSVAAVLAAAPDELLSVPGIGPERVRAVQDVLHLSVSGSGDSVGPAP
jgi:ERCC4-type nuclease